MAKLPLGDENRGDFTPLKIDVEVTAVELMTLVRFLDPNRDIEPDDIAILWAVTNQMRVKLGMDPVAMDAAAKKGGAK